MTLKDTQQNMPDFGTEARNLANLWTNGNYGDRTCILAALERAYKAGGIDTTGALLLAVSDIHAIPGIGGKPMLSELGTAVRALIADKDAQIANLFKASAGKHLPTDEVEAAEVNKTRHAVMHYIKGSQGVANRRNIANAANREARKTVPPLVLACALQSLVHDGSLTREAGTRPGDSIYRTSRFVPIWKQPRKGGTRGRTVSSIEDLILHHVSKNGGERNYADLTSALAYRAKPEEVFAKLNEMAAAGKLIVTQNVKRNQGRPATVISLTPLAVAEAKVKAEATEAAAAAPTVSTPRPARKKELTEHRLRLAIGEIGGRATIAELTDELKSDEEDVNVILTALINAGTVRTMAIRGETYYRVAASRED